jgi:hypothetical protein
VFRFGVGIKFHMGFSRLEMWLRNVVMNVVLIKLKWYDSLISIDILWRI